MVMLDNFLGYFKLRTGCLFIGYCGAIFSMLFLIICGIGIVFTAVRENSLTGYEQTLNEIGMGLAVYIFIACAVSFPLHVVLLRGVYKKLPRLLNTYLNAMTAYLAISFVIALIASTFSPQQGCSYALSFGLSVYYLLVVKSHRTEIENSINLLPTYTKA